MPRGKINWIAVRTAYVVKRWSAQRCAEEFGIHPSTIKNRASTEGWGEERDRLATNATAIATEQITSDASLVLDAVRADHAVIVKRAHSVLDGIEEDLAAIKPGRSRIEARKAAADAYGSILKATRLVLGIRDGESSVAVPSSDSAPGKEYVVAITPEGEQAQIA